MKCKVPELGQFEKQCVLYRCCLETLTPLNYCLNAHEKLTDALQWPVHFSVQPNVRCGCMLERQLTVRKKLKYG